MNNEYLMKHLRSIEDFPKQGINFRDVTTLFKDAKCIKIMDKELYELYKDKGITKVVGIESRGFIMGAILARRLGAGLVMCRKPGKLPAETVSQTFEKEYGTDTIEIHKDAITEDDVVVNKRDLPQELRNALMEVKESMEGKKNLMTWEELVNELDD